jgi:hypothetical protein
MIITKVIFEHGETWWNDIYRILILPPELCGNPTSNNLIAK